MAMATSTSGETETFSVADDDEDESDEFRKSLISTLSGLPTVKVKLHKKLLYAVGGLPYALSLNVIGFYFSLFLLDVALIDPLYVSAIVLSGRVWDALTDPIIGNLTLRTRTRFGRLRPWLFIFTIPGALVFFFIWFIPVTSWSMPVRFTYYYLLYLAFQALLTCYHVPYTALIMHVTDDYKQRDSATFYRMIVETFGMLLGNAVFAAYIAIFADSDSKTCIDGRRIAQGSGGGTEKAYWLGALTISCVYIISGLVCVMGTKEQNDQQGIDKRVSFFKGIKQTLQFKPYLMLIMIYMLGWIAVNFLQANFSLYVIHGLNMRDQFQYVIVVLLIFMVMAMPFWQRVIKRFGKKFTLICGYLLYIPTVISFCMLPMQEKGETLWWKIAILYLVSIINGCGISAMNLSIWSMLPDVVEESELEYGVRREELFYAYFIFFTKFGAGVTLGLSNVFLKLGEYDVLKCEQNANTRLTLRLLMSVGPVLLLLASLLLIDHYPITEERRRATKIELENKKRRRKKRPSFEKHTPADSCVEDNDLMSSQSILLNDTACVPGHLSEHNLGAYGTNGTNRRGTNGHTDEVIVDEL